MNSIVIRPFSESSETLDSETLQFFYSAKDAAFDFNVSTTKSYR